MRFSIVTPVLDGESFIDETILSVVAQAGPFTIRYHVQDGGSRDGTLDRLARWQARLRHDFPILCNGVEFSYSSGPDGGMYGAINIAFAICRSGDVMAWINADDRFEPGAFSSVATILGSFDDIEWVAGRTTVIDESGAMTVIQPPPGYPRKAIVAGLFDGRHSPAFIMQEGSFWRTRLWQKTGGLRSDFRLAGDFDLWRRFAQRSDRVSADAIFGCFRMRSGQLSESQRAYHTEIDLRMSKTEMGERAEVLNLLRSCRSPEELRAAGFSWRTVENHPKSGGWICKEHPAS
jgi:glycosyltransferase involved in cell wall biosynthesis